MVKIKTINNVTLLDTTAYVLFQSTSGETPVGAKALSDNINNYERITIISNMGTLDIPKKHYGVTYRLQRAADSNGSYYAGAHLKLTDTSLICTNYTNSNVAIHLYGVYGYKYQ